MFEVNEKLLFAVSREEQRAVAAGYERTGAE
jgi:hypothetical protein